MEKRISTLAVASVALRQWMGHHRGSGGILCEFGCVSREAVVVVGVPRPHQIQSSKRRCLCFATQRNLWENGKSSAEVPRLPAYTSYHHRRHCGTPKGHTAATEGYVTNMLPRLSR